MNKKSLYLVFIISIGSFELYVFNMTFHPKVNDHYKMYYINKQLHSWSHGQGIKYDRGTRLNSKSMTRLLSRTGWSKSKESRRWAINKDAIIYFTTKKTLEYQGVLSLDTSEHDFQGIQVTINDKYLEKNKTKPNKEITYNFEPSIINKDKLNIIKFKVLNKNNTNISHTNFSPVYLNGFKIE